MTEAITRPEAPLPLATEGPVPRLQPMRVLFAYDGSAHADEARKFLCSLPLPPGSRVQVLTVLEATPWRVPESLAGAEQEWAMQRALAAVPELNREGVELENRVVRGDAAHEILRAAADMPADLVVIGPTGRHGLAEFVLGSVASNVAKHAEVPVLVAREPAHAIRQVIVAIDESTHGSDVLACAARFPLAPGTEFIVCHVVRPYQYPGPPEYVPEMLEMLRQAWDEQRTDAEKLAETARQTLEDAGRTTSISIREGDPAREIVSLAAETHADLIIAGARGIS